jgi:hypothetical protein
VLYGINLHAKLSNTSKTFKNDRMRYEEHKWTLYRSHWFALIHNTSCSTRIVLCRPSLRLVLKSNWSTHPAPPSPVLEHMRIQISHNHKIRNPSLVVSHSYKFIASMSIWNVVYKIKINNSLLHIFFLSNRFFAHQWTLVLSNGG